MDGVEDVDVEIEGSTGKVVSSTSLMGTHPTVEESLIGMALMVVGGSKCFLKKTF